MDLINFFVLASSLLNLSLSIIVHNKPTQNPSTKAFRYMIYAITGWCISMFFYRLLPSGPDLIAARFLYFFPPFIPVCFLIFGLLFPTEKVSKALVTFLIAVTFFVGLLNFYNGSIIKDVVTIVGQEKNLIFGWGYYYIYQFFIPIFFTLSFLVLIQKYLKGNSIIKTQIIYILGGMMMSSTPAMITNLLLPSRGIFVLNWFGQISTVIWVAFSTYAILRHRLLGIPFVIGKAIYLILISCVPFAVFYFAYFLEVYFWKSVISIEALTIGFFISMGFVYLFIYSNTLLKRLIFRSVINRGTDFSDSQKILEKKLSTEMNLDTISDTLLETIEKAVLTNFCGVVLFKDRSESPYLKTLHYKGPLSSIHSCNPYAYWDEQKVKEPLILDELQLLETPKGQSKTGLTHIIAAMKHSKISAIFPLNETLQTNGFIFLSEKKTHSAYAAEEINFITTLLNQTSVAIGRALLYENVQHFNTLLQQKVDDATHELKGAYDKLQKAYEQLERLDQMKSDFISITSHDLRTPLSIMRNYLWLVLNNDKTKTIDPESLKNVKISYESVERMIRLVNNTLSVSKIDSGHLEIKPILQPFEPILDSIAMEFTDLAKLKNRVFVYNMSEKSVPQLVIDRDRIREVIVNLLTNAFHYTEDGATITLTCKVNNKNVEISVHDTGKGIKPEDMSRLFKRFSRIENSLTIYTPDATGNGLGLYISKTIIDFHKGKIWAESEVGKGTTFMFTLPIAES